MAVAGAAGRMGQAVCAAVEGAEDLELVGGADPLLGTALAQLLGDAEVVVDFTRPDVALENALACVQAGVHVVIGTTGFDPAPLERARRPRGRPANVFFAPNFAIGAVLMMRFCAEAARHMERAEIIELHHEGKLDAPSGTALATAERMAKARGEEWEGPKGESLEGVRGGDVQGIRIHSVRLPGLVAHQEVIFGGVGQTLTIRHDSMQRVSFMPGVILAIKEVIRRPGVTVGLEPLLGLDEVGL